jgi:peptidoglycan hydrolase-like protein with peptidoglycan-binding domain
VKKIYTILASLLIFASFSFFLSAPASAQLTSTLSTGSVTPEVTLLQRILNGIGKVVSPQGPGSPGQETTTFGSMTASAVRSFQCDKGIVCSGTPETTGWGIVGPRTRALLNSLSSSFSSLSNLFSQNKTSQTAGVLYTGPSPTSLTTFDSGGTAGKIGDAKLFDGSTGVNIGTTNLSFDRTSPFSICAWVNPNNINEENPIISKYDSSSKGYELGTSDSNDGKIEFTLANNYPGSHHLFINTTQSVDTCLFYL